AEERTAADFQRAFEQPAAAGLQARIAAVVDQARRDRTEDAIALLFTQHRRQVAGIARVVDLRVAELVIDFAVPARTPQALADLRRHAAAGLIEVRVIVDDAEERAAQADRAVKGPGLKERDVVALALLSAGGFHREGLAGADEG